jgi:hypothetical protein
VGIRHQGETVSIGAHNSDSPGSTPGPGMKEAALISITLALLLSPSSYAHDWRSPDYRVREAATVRLERLGPYAYPICTALSRHRDAEVRNRALGTFARLYEVKRPLASAEFPRYSSLVRAVTWGMPTRLAGRVQAAMNDRLRDQWMAWVGLEQYKRQTPAQDTLSDRAFALYFMDSLVWRKRFPPAIAQSIVNRAAWLEQQEYLVSRWRSFDFLTAVKNTCEWIWPGEQ